MDEEICRKLLTLPAVVTGTPDGQADLSALRQAAVAGHLAKVDERNAQFFDQEVLKLDRWSEDLKLSLECELKALDREIKDIRRTAALAQSLQDKLAHQKQLRELERKRNAKRKELFEAQNAIDQQREELIGKIERQLEHSIITSRLFDLLWHVV